MCNLNVPLISHACVKNEHFTAVNMASNNTAEAMFPLTQTAINGNMTIQIFIFIVFQKNDERFVRESTLAMILQSLKYQKKYAMKVCPQGKGPFVMLPGSTS